MSKDIRIIDTSSITPLVERLAKEQPPWYDFKLLLRAWFAYHLTELQDILLEHTKDIEFAKTLPIEFLLGDEFAISRLYKNTQLVLAPYVNSRFHDRANLLIMPASVILVYNDKVFHPHEKQSHVSTARDRASYRVSGSASTKLSPSLQKSVQELTTPRYRHD